MALRFACHSLTSVGYWTILINVLLLNQFLTIYATAQESQSLLQRGDELFGGVNSKGILQLGQSPGSPLVSFEDYRHVDMKFCSINSNLTYLFYVHSPPENWKKRHILRTTWANTALIDNGIARVIFMLGLSRDDNVNSAVASEIHEYSDIVQGEFIDHDLNSTLKAVMAMRWINAYCKNAAFAIKTNDDTFVNIFKFLLFIEKHLPFRKENVIICNRQSHVELSGHIDFDRALTKSKNRLNQMHCSSSLYVLSIGIIPELLRNVKKTEIIYMDNIYVTGFLANTVRNVRFVSFVELQLIDRPDILEEYYKDPNKAFDPHISPLAGSTNSDKQFMRIWNFLLPRLDKLYSKYVNISSLNVVLAI